MAEGYVLIFYYLIAVEETFEDRMQREREMAYLEELNRRLNYHIEFTHPTRLSWDKIFEDMQIRRSYNERNKFSSEESSPPSSITDLGM